MLTPRAIGRLKSNGFTPVKPVGSLKITIASAKHTGKEGVFAAYFFDTRLALF
jgi:hypothetical protein